MKDQNTCNAPSRSRQNTQVIALSRLSHTNVLPSSFFCSLVVNSYCQSHLPSQSRPSVHKNHHKPKGNKAGTRLRGGEKNRRVTTTRLASLVDFSFAFSITAEPAPRLAERISPLVTRSLSTNESALVRVELTEIQSAPYKADNSLKRTLAGLGEN